MASSRKRLWAVEFEKYRQVALLQPMEGCQPLSRSTLDNFFEDLDGPATPRMYDEILEFCQDVAGLEENLEKGIGAAGYNRTVWIDDGASVNNKDPHGTKSISRLGCPPQLLSPTGLYRTLYKSVKSLSVILPHLNYVAKGRTALSTT